MTRIFMHPKDTVNANFIPLSQCGVISPEDAAALRLAHSFRAGPSPHHMLGNVSPHPPIVRPLH